MPPTRPTQNGQAKSIVVQYALFRWENAVLIAGGILLTWLLPRPFPWWPWWGWLVLAGTGVTAVFVTSLKNERANAQLLLSEFQGQFDLRQIKQVELRQDVDTALEYQRRIEARVRQQHKSLLWDRPEDTANQLHDWIVNIYQLALRLDAYRRDTLIAREKESVPKELQSLRLRRQKESNEAFQQEFERLIESKSQQLEAIQALETRMKQAELQLAQSLAALATINSQVQLIEAQDADSGRSQRITGDIQEQVNRLNDLVSSINEVYDYHTQGMG
ncbi:MAG: hypothetical protein ACOYYS_05580 [Chloroflexota bacterium]